MNCPVCRDTALNMTERQGVEIDYCPKCRGVWLDRGELDKIIERTAAAESQSANSQWDRQRDMSPDDYGPDYGDRHSGKHHRKRKRRGLLGELFDFD